jgi:hypothetical protein
VRNPVLWWLGPGEVSGLRALRESGNSSNWNRIDVGAGASQPAGSVDVSPSLARPAQMATARAYDSRANSSGTFLAWVHSNGDLMISRVTDLLALPLVSFLMNLGPLSGRSPRLVR